MMIPEPGNQGRQEIAELAEKVHFGISEAVQKALCYAKQNHGCNIGDAAYVSTMAALASTELATLAFAKKPDCATIEDMEAVDLHELITHEAHQFACLVASVTVIDRQPKKKAFTSDFGPGIFWEALQMWQLLNPGKDPDKYLDKGMLQAARACGENSTLPFDEFLKKRNLISPSSGTRH